MLLSQYKFGAFLSLLILGFISFWLVNGYSVVSADSHPTVLSIELLNDNPTQDQELVFEITFSEEVSGLDGGDFQVSTTGDIVGESIVSIDVADVVPGSVGPTAYTGIGLDDAVFSGSYTNTATCGLVLGIFDTSGPVDEFGFGTEGDEECSGGSDEESIPITPGVPQELVDGVYVTFASGTGHTAIEFLTEDDFTNYWSTTLTGATGGAVYHVTVDRGTGSGTLHLAFLDDDTVIDVDGNPVGDSGLNNGDFTDADAYIIPSMLGTGTEENPYQITDCKQLQSMNEDLTAYYQLQNDIDCSDTVNWNAGEGFMPVGDAENDFSGTLDGNGYTISSLTIRRSYDDQGLFGFIGEDGIVFNLVLLDSLIEIPNDGYGQNVGVLAAQSYGSISQITVSGGTVSALRKTGGVVGTMKGGTMSEVAVDNIVISVEQDAVGGVVGSIDGDLEIGILIDGVYVDSATEIFGETGVGGVAGIVAGPDAVIQDSSSQAVVVARSYYAGGFVGIIIGGAQIQKSFATGDVSYDEEIEEDVGIVIGGFAGLVAMGGIIEDSFATGNVSGADMVGGFAGLVGQYGGLPPGGGYIHRVYSTGVVTGNTNVGGLVGLESNNDGEITYSYWDMETSGQSTSSAGTGKTTAEMQNIATYIGWDIIGVDAEFDSLYPILWTEEDSDATWIIFSTGSEQEEPTPTRRSSGGSVQQSVSNLQKQGKTEQAQEIKDQFPHLFTNETPTIESLTKKLVELQTLLQQLQSSSDSLSCTPSLKRGSTGEQVRILQTKLNIAPTDGIFGPQTEQAVRTFQSQKNLTVDGVVGPRTCVQL